jgi:hypothetical protein
MAIFDLRQTCAGSRSVSGQGVDNYFARPPADFLSPGPGDIRHVIDMALSGRGAQAAAS